MKRIAIFLAALFIASSAIAANYGVEKRANPTKGWHFGKAWAIIYKKGHAGSLENGWSRKVRQVLLKRGFSQKQAKIYSAMQINFMVTGKAYFNWLQLPIQVNTETGRLLPLDPVGYAKGIPQCAADDETKCKLKYGAHVGFKVAKRKGKLYINTSKRSACRLTQRQRQYCRQKEFKLSVLGGHFGCYQAGLGSWNECAGLVSFEPEGSKSKSKLAFAAKKKNKVARSSKKQTKRRTSYGPGYCAPVDYADACGGPKGSRMVGDLRGPFSASVISKW